jgi:hypothetical protein
LSITTPSKRRITDPEPFSGTQGEPYQGRNGPGFDESGHDRVPNEFATVQFARALAGLTGREIKPASVKALEQAFDEETQRTDLTNCHGGQ